ncbi:hypothetical protein [Rhodopirellula bahusiensis]|uniref:hypothetical protein n=1 Tax=Rhodopirellula bahusiensis TaxID=2014065 RepID=UPI003265FA20
MTSAPLPELHDKQSETNSDPLALPKLDESLKAARSAISKPLGDNRLPQDLSKSSRRFTAFLARFAHPEADRFIAVSSATEWQRQWLQQVRAGSLLIRRAVLIFTAVIAFFRRYALLIVVLLLLALFIWLLIAFWPEIERAFEDLLNRLTRDGASDIDTPP